MHSAKTNDGTESGTGGDIEFGNIFGAGPFIFRQAFLTNSDESSACGHGFSDFAGIGAGWGNGAGNSQSEDGNF
jgi:hypothetical protein